MGIIKDMTDELVRRQGFEAGVKGAPPRIFLSNGEHKKAYYDGYELGQKGAVPRAIQNVSEKLSE